MQQHRKLIRKEEIQENEYYKVQQTAQIGEAFKTKTIAFQIVETKQQDFSNYVDEKLEILKQYLLGPNKKYIIEYGGHDEENDKCPLNQQLQQNQNSTTNKFNSSAYQTKLPQITFQTTKKSQFNQKQTLDLQIPEERQKIFAETYKIIDNEQNKFNSNLQQRKYINTKKNATEDTQQKSIQKSKCNCIKYDKIFEQSYNINEEAVMKLSKFQIKYREKDQEILKQTIHYQQDLFDQKQLEQLKEQEKEKKLKKHQEFPIVKLNQCIGKKEDQLLNSTGRFWTSSMIDGYANNLFGSDEKYYFSLSKTEREIHQRLFIFTSDFITNCNLNQQPLYNKWFLLMLEKLEIFKTIQYQFWLIYQKIAFVVNINNSHWYMITLNLQERYIIVYDSLGANYQHYQMVGELLSYLFYQLQKKTLIKQNIKQDQYKFKVYQNSNFKQQNDSYSCGYYTCIALEHFSNLKQIKDYKNKNEIKDILNKILLHQTI